MEDMHPRKGPASTVGALLASSLAWCACGDTPVPSYGVQSTVLRLIPDTPAISAAGGEVLVVLELNRDVDSTAGAFTTVVQSFGGSLTPLPGSTLCPAPDAGAVPDAASPAAASIPSAAFRANDNQVDTFESAITVAVPPGNGDVLLVAATYASTDAGSGPCAIDPGQLLAFGTTRITRMEASSSNLDAAAAVDGGATVDADEADADGTSSGGEESDGPAADDGNDQGDATTFPTDGATTDQ
jgi:hypothetical protein